MRFLEFKQPQQPDLIGIIKEVLPIIKKELGLHSIPKIHLVNHIADKEQPTFGR